jgi:hypothetical protein
VNWSVFAYVFAHNHEGVNASKCLTHNTDLFGGDVITVDENTFGVFVAGFLDVSPNFVFSFLWVSDYWHIY